MSADSKADFNPEVLKGLIEALLTKAKALPKTSMQKLLYLIEREFILEHKKLAVGLKYRHESFGMYSPDLANFLDGLVTIGFLDSAGVSSDLGQGKRYMLKDKKRIAIPDNLKNVVDRVYEKFGKLSMTELMREAKNTAPFIYSKRGEWLDWNLLIEEVCLGAHDLTPEIERQLRQAQEQERQGKLRNMTPEEALELLEQ
jgi:uncharacterized protein YwgA